VRGRGRIGGEGLEKAKSERRSGRQCDASPRRRDAKTGDSMSPIQSPGRRHPESGGFRSPPQVAGSCLSRGNFWRGTSDCAAAVLPCVHFPSCLVIGYEMTVIALESMPVPEVSPLLESARQGEEVAFEEIVRANESMVFSIAFHSIRNQAIAEELAQEAFLKLYRNLGGIESEAHLVNWLRRTTSNLVVDHVRKHRLTPVELEETHEVTSTDVKDPWVSARLRNLLRELPVKQRLVVTLRYQEEMGPGEIAEVLRLPINTVRSHLRRALAVLRSNFTAGLESNES